MFEDGLTRPMRRRTLVNDKTLLSGEAKGPEKVEEDGTQSLISGLFANFGD